MNALKRLRASLIIVLALVATMVPGGLASAAAPPAQGVRISPIGNPTWMPVDFHLFAATIGTATTGYAEFLQTTLDLLPPPNHVFHPALGAGPGAPHAPPYDNELAQGVAAQGFHDEVVFATSDFSGGQGVYLAWMNVPVGPTTGSSPDFSTGPIIPNTLFPITVVGTDYHNGKKFSDLADFTVPPLDQTLSPPFNVDGHSHFPLFIVDAQDFGPAGAKLRGSYQYSITMTDQSGNGWLVEAHFAIAH